MNPVTRFIVVLLGKGLLAVVLILALRAVVDGVY